MINLLIKCYLALNSLLVKIGFKLEYVGHMRYERMRSLGFDVLVDVGASRGQSIEYRRSMLSKDIQIYSFEPLKSDFLILEKKYGNDELIKLFNLGLGQKTQKILINIGDQHDTSSILKPTKLNLQTYDQNFLETQEVKISTLDLELGSTLRGKNILMKIDVQGFELEVLRGGLEIIKNIRMIIIELSYLELYKGQPLFDDVYRFLKEKGFTYIGSHYQSISPKNGQPMQQDAIFIKP